MIELAGAIVIAFFAIVLLIAFLPYLILLAVAAVVVAVLIGLGALLHSHNLLLPILAITAVLVFVVGLFNAVADAWRWFKRRVAK